MKTADDTFKKLQGYTYSEISDILCDEYRRQSVMISFIFYCLTTIEEASIYNIDILQTRNKILAQHGWTHHKLTQHVFGICNEAKTMKH